MRQLNQPFKQYLKHLNYEHINYNQQTEKNHISNR